mmetsp:Transcript_81809/g.265144  ORF Transcript_81809/g.265144 Transcript_81809/m.265144 type:complete len:243 (+) Transcript_81809:1720-2448(+)
MHPSSPAPTVLTCSTPGRPHRQSTTPPRTYPLVTSGSTGIPSRIRTSPPFSGRRPTRRRTWEASCGIGRAPRVQVAAGRRTAGCPRASRGSPWFLSAWRTPGAFVLTRGSACPGSGSGSTWHRRGTRPASTLGATSGARSSCLRRSRTPAPLRWATSASSLAGRPGTASRTSWASSGIGRMSTLTCIRVQQCSEAAQPSNRSIQKTRGTSRGTFQAKPQRARGSTGPARCTSGRRTTPASTA